MTDEPVEPRRQRGAALLELAREDLDLYAIADLEERIGVLEDEIIRTRAQIDRKRSGRDAADALFSRRN
jgi:uncharacterized small protein (DUF1192 family)